MNNRSVAGIRAALRTGTTPHSTQGIRTAGVAVTGKNYERGNQASQADERVDNPADRGRGAVHQCRQPIDLEQSYQTQIDGTEDYQDESNYANCFHSGSETSNVYAMSALCERSVIACEPGNSAIFCLKSDTVPVPMN